MPCTMLHAQTACMCRQRLQRGLQRGVCAEYLHMFGCKQKACVEQMLYEGSNGMLASCVKGCKALLKT